MLDPTAGWTLWRPIGLDLAALLLSRLATEFSPWFAEVEARSARATALPFYRRHELYELVLGGASRTDTIYVLASDDAMYWLNGDSAPIHSANRDEVLLLTDQTVDAYIRFFLYFLRGDEGAFALFEVPNAITLHAASEEQTELAQRLAAARTRATAMRVEYLADLKCWHAHTIMRYGNALYTTMLELFAEGQLLMEADDYLVDVTGLDGPAYPMLRPTRLSMEARAAAADGDDENVDERDDTPDPGPAAEDTSDSEVADEPADWPPTARKPGVHAGESASSSAPPTDEEKQSRARRLRQLERGQARDRDTTEVLVAVLLEEAMRNLEPDPLVRHFNAGTQPDQGLQVLAQMLDASSPIVIIESDIPFVEEFAAGILEPRLRLLDEGRIHRADTANTDDGVCSITVREGRAALYLLSFHAHRTLWAAEKTAHDLTIQEAAVLVGCSRSLDVPEPLRRVADLVLRLPRIDRRVFASVFNRLFGVPPVDGWDDPAVDWTRYLLPADFHFPRRLGLAPADALVYLRDRASRRLESVTPHRAPALSDLHGMAEARAVCEDLIADIRAAQAGALSWDHVDRGLLLVGRPGTGKTTLARAIARECGVKFITTSATAWQAAGNLDQHLRAMRSSFAEARRYAPAILFIDEVDSIGNRENFTGSNAIYQTEVVNALLEQMQGMDPAEPVIVIAATNHERNVDPALRRAGRLDQVVRIPLPSVGALDRIFQFYLKPFAAAGELAPDIDTRIAATLASGNTGADVDFFVRGAARRARKARRVISQSDLLAEVTRRPRHPGVAASRGTDALYRTAVHEAGHTVAMLLGPQAGAEITFVSIVPRLDGSLGFTASMPPDGAVATRASVQHYLEVLLAGRAAEAEVFGEEHIGLGAGGPSETSDLAIATRLATDLVCRTGFGDDGSLLWTAEPTREQLVSVDAMLRRASSTIRARLAMQRELLERVAAVLVEREEVTGEELRKMLT